MIDRDGRNEALVLQVLIKTVDIFCEKHTLIDQGFLTKRANVKLWNSHLARSAFDAATADIQNPLAFNIAAIFFIAEHDLLDFWARVSRFLSDD